MYVHPDGLKPTTGGLDHIYTTDTNRMDDGPEVLVWYTPRGRPDFAAFMVYDWSCSPAYPCPPPENYTVPAFVTILELSEPAARCNLDVQTDSNGHAHQLLYFASITRKLDNGSPPLWVNRVLLWNYCYKAWDLHYEHQYRLNADNCAFSHTCGGWAAILEIFESSTGEPYPEIRELGFERSRLLHDGVWSELPPSETHFVDPVPPWKLFHRRSCGDRGRSLSSRAELSPYPAALSVEVGGTTSGQEASGRALDGSGRTLGIASSTRRFRPAGLSLAHPG